IQECLLLREEGLKYQPDLVLLGFYAFNDIRDNSKALNELMWGPQVILTWGRPYAGGDNAKGALKFEFPDIHRLRRANFERRERFTKEYEMAPTYSRLATSMLTRYVLRQWLKKMQPLEFDPAVLFGPYLEGDAIPHAAEWKQAWDTTERVLLATRDTAREAGAKFAIFTIPSRFQVDAHYREMVADQVAGLKFDLQKPEKQLVDFGQQEGIPVLDLTPVFSEVQEKQGTPLHHQLEDEHWNPNGHALAATAVRKFLEEQRLLP
ncbi:MAG: hypothetical protein HYZ00_13655, partial [Candidatus Hydrogenedentes bacterium]|nr:hypothetical protein [Candidatus Hydrogenedentota bacterium]